MTKEVLGVIGCEGCNGDAHIKKRATGKKLLYLHCTNCGLDQRSGAVLQTKWQSAIDMGAELPAENTNTNEWRPAEEVKNEISTNQEQSESNKDNDSNGSGKSRVNWIVGVGIILAAVIGIRAS